VARYDRATWTSVTTASTKGGLASDVVNAVLEDSTGAMWFATPNLSGLMVLGRPV